MIELSLSLEFALFDRRSFRVLRIIQKLRCNCKRETPCILFVLKRHPVPMAFVEHRSSGLITNLKSKSFIKALSVMRTG